MTVFFVWGLPLILVLVMLWMFGKTFNSKDEKDSPFALLHNILWFLGALAPIVGWIIFAILLIWYLIKYNDDDYDVKDN